MDRWMRHGLAVLAAGCLLAGCAPTRPAGPAAPSTRYAKVMPAPATAGRGQCLNDEEAAAVRGRIVQQELAYAARACSMSAEYNQFATKFSADLSANGSQLGALLRRRGLNINSYVTDIANKVAARAPGHGGFCSDAREAFRWALQPSMTRLNDVPPLYDNTADHGMRPCNPPAAR